MRLCRRCGHEKCIDKKFIPYKFLNQYSEYKDCSAFTGPKPIDRTGDGASRIADEQRSYFLRDRRFNERRN